MLNTIRSASTESPCEWTTASDERFTREKIAADHAARNCHVPVDRNPRFFLERGPNASKRSTPKCRDEINRRQRNYTDAREAELLLASSDREADSSRPGSEKSGSNQPNEPPLGFVKFTAPQHSSK
jgi:hypothetical protein